MIFRYKCECVRKVLGFALLENYLLLMLVSFHNQETRTYNPTQAPSRSLGFLINRRIHENMVQSFRVQGVET